MCSSCCWLQFPMACWPVAFSILTSSPIAKPTSVPVSTIWWRALTRNSPAGVILCWWWPTCLSGDNGDNGLFQFMVAAAIAGGSGRFARSDDPAAKCHLDGEAGAGNTHEHCFSSSPRPAVTLGLLVSG